VSLRKIRKHVKRGDNRCERRQPAMVAGIADHIWTCEEIADLLD
jgi:hypothetical protein